MNECGGIQKTNVITFQTQVMLGAQFAKLKEAQAKAEEDNKLDEACRILIVACLRVAWNDAFRHVTKNVENLENKFKKNGEFSDMEHEYEAGAVAFAWFIWEKGYKGEPIIRWFN